MKIQYVPVFFLSMLFAGCMTDGDEDDGGLSLGTYQYSETQWPQRKEYTGDPAHTNIITISYKLQWELKADKTYLRQAYITSVDLGWTNMLIVEEKGSYTKNEKALLLKDVLEREPVSYGSGQMSPWTVPAEGASDTIQIRNVTPGTFQTYDKDEKSWTTWSRL